MKYSDVENRKEKLIIVLSVLYESFSKEEKTILSDLKNKYAVTDEERESIYGYADKMGYIVMLPGLDSKVIRTMLYRYRKMRISDVGIEFIQKELDERYRLYRVEKRKHRFEFLKWIVPTLIALLSWLFVRK